PVPGSYPSDPRGCRLQRRPGRGGQPPPRPAAFSPVAAFPHRGSTGPVRAPAGRPREVPLMGEGPAGLRLAGQTVAEYVLDPVLDPTLSPRPYLHPVRTRAGVTLTDALPADHRWHLGASLAVQDVSGTNLWGGRTYVRGTGYTWRA